jgi:hypothetical protein
MIEDYWKQMNGMRSFVTRCIYLRLAPALDDLTCTSREKKIYCPTNQKKETKGEFRAMRVSMGFHSWNSKRLFGRLFFMQIFFLGLAGWLGVIFISLDKFTQTQGPPSYIRRKVSHTLCMI